MVENKDNKNCCGCEACVQKCPKKCISLVQDKEGFWYPHVDESLCIGCKLCDKVCPYNEKSEFSLSKSEEKLFAYKNDSSDILKESSSGGAFTELATCIIEHGGVVYGAAFKDDWSVHHICIDNIEGLKKLRGSKYVQSNIEDCYIDAERKLQKGIMVLFTGTPCQILGLKNFLRKDYPKLLTVDFICHGVPSPGIWKRYLDEEFGKEETCRLQAADGKNTVLNSSLNAKSPIGDIKFRDKTDGWEKFRFVVRRKSAVKADKNSVLLSDIHRDNPFMKGFLSDIYLRPSCYNCPAKKGRSGSDIQMADFWGIREVDRKFYSSKGVSMLIVHTQKGMDFLNKMKGWIKQIDEQVELLNQSYSHCAIPHPRREEFFYRVDNEDLISVINELTKQKITERVYFYIRVCLKYFRINHFINKMKAKWERK